MQVQNELVKLQNTRTFTQKRNILCKILCTPCIFVEVEFLQAKIFCCLFKHCSGFEMKLQIQNKLLFYNSGCFQASVFPNKDINSSLLFFTETCWSFFCWDTLVICLTVAFKLSLTVLISLYQGWPTCFDWDRLENFLITRDRSIGNRVTSTKCHKMQRFPVNAFVFTTHYHWELYFHVSVNLVLYLAISQYSKLWLIQIRLIRIFAKLDKTGGTDDFLRSSL